MTSGVGIVCGRCDRWSSIGTPTCAHCGLELALPTDTVAASSATSVESTPAGAAALLESSAPAARLASTDELESLGEVLGKTLRRRRSNANTPAQAAGAPVHLATKAIEDKAPLSLEELMEQAKNYVCRSCSTPVPLGHKFCGRCGASVPADIMAARTQFFGQLQQPGKAKLILIRGEGVEGLSYQLSAEQHIVGRSGQLVFSDDPYVSPVHANLFYRDEKLVVRDEGSLNGVYLRVRGSTTVAFGQMILAGEQLFCIEGPPEPSDQADAAGTMFYTSPKAPASMRLVQVLQGGALGMAVCARASGLQIGREGSDLNFPSDLYMSASHCRVEAVGGEAVLTDLNSRNGTYVRLDGERELSHGDYLFIGKKLLRVEITAA